MELVCFFLSSEFDELALELLEESQERTQCLQGCGHDPARLVDFDDSERFDEVVLDLLTFGGKALLDR